MADVDKVDRTWLCSVLFTDIANYSSQSVELQMKWKQRFNAYLTDAIREVPESERVILDTGDGAAVCFLGAPEAAMFAALQLSREFTLDEREHKPGLRVRIGINLGPVKLVKDINGALNAIGDGINAGQRIMSFAADNQILVSQSFYEVVSRVSDDYKLLFQLKGVEKDKHVREHTVYHLTPPDAEGRPQTVANSDGRVIAAAPALVTETVAPPASKGKWLPWLVAGAAVAGLAVVGVTHFSGSSAQSAPQTTVAQSPAPVAATTAPKSLPVDAPAVVKPAASTPSPTSDTAEPPGGRMPGGRRGRALAKASAAASPEAKAAYDDGVRLIAADKPAEAAHHFDDAIHVQPDYIDAYVGRAEARRALLQFDMSLQDCNKVIQLAADDPRGFNCRGSGRQLMKQYDAALPDFTEAIRLNPNFLNAYERRGATYEQLQQFDRAVEDYTHAVSLAPRNALGYMRLGTACSNMKQYGKAIHNFTEAIRLQPNLPNAYRLRAIAEQASGDTAGAAADRAHIQDAPRRKKNNQ